MCFNFYKGLKFVLQLFQNLPITHQVKKFNMFHGSLRLTSIFIRHRPLTYPNEIRSQPYTRNTRRTWCSFSSALILPLPKFVLLHSGFLNNILYHLPRSASLGPYGLFTLTIFGCKQTNYVSPHYEIFSGILLLELSV